MKYFVHLKDDVVFAWHQSETEVDIPGDNVIQVESNPESYLTKKYVNGQFVNPQLIKYATLDSSNTVVAINETYFSSDIKDGIIITDDNVKVLWKWDGTSFISPDGVLPVPVIPAPEPLPTPEPINLEELQAQEVANAAANANLE